MTMEEIRDKVLAEGDVRSFRMDTVRDAYGAGRLGIHVRAGISKALQGLGLGHYPRELPDSQDAQIRLYRLGSNAADLIEAVLNPSASTDEKVRSATSGDADKILKSVRELVCP